jgi:flagellar biosynthesis protein FlhG|uniref:MinD/ParA family protein n=1 Tax=Desulfobacca acetoxidans TaxID=60893 RepID=A0A7C5AMJ4_9BACT
MNRLWALDGLEEKRLGMPLPGDSPGRPFRVITVTSGKGGVGKSNVVVNLGLAFSRQGLKVLLIDADLGLANLDILLGLTPQFTIKDLLSLRKSISEVMAEGPEGIKILPASSGIPELAELDEYQKMFLLNELDNYSENLDVVLIDTGAGISRNVLFFNIAAMERIVVVNNEPTSITDAYALMKVLVTKHRETRFKLLVNGLNKPQEGDLVFRAMLRVTERFLGKDISLEYLGAIPHDDAIPKAVLKQQAALALYPKAKVSRYFTQLARNLWEAPPPPELGSNIRFFWRRLLHRHL